MIEMRDDFGSSGAEVDGEDVVFQEKTPPQTPREFGPNAFEQIYGTVAWLWPSFPAYLRRIHIERWSEGKIPEDVADEKMREVTLFDSMTHTKSIQIETE